MRGDLSSLRFVDVADVYKAGTRAATLTRDQSGAVTFAYDPGYTGERVATTLPVETGSLTVPGGGLPPFFAGLLPEGHRLSVVRDATKTSLDDELTLLLAVGADVPGDVQVVPQGEEPSAAPPVMSGDPAELDFRALAESMDPHGIPGVQAKASASMVNVPVLFRSTPSIIKLDPPQHPHLVANEALHLEHAQRLKIPVTKWTVVRDSSGIPGLVVSRFDRHRADAGSFLRLAMEDAAQLLGVLPAAKYSVDAVDVVRAVVSNVDAPVLAARNLYIQFLYSWLTGNGDLHAKNVSVLRGADGRWAVAPVYDVPCTALYRDFSLALPVAGKTAKVSGRHWRDFAEEIGLPEKSMRSLNRMVLKVASAIDLSALPFEGSLLNGAQREVARRRGKLEEFT